MESKTEMTRFKNAKVYYRIFPMLNMRWDHVKILEDVKTLYVRYIQDFGTGRDGVVPSYWRFTTDGVFYNESQLAVYNGVTRDILDKVIDGCSAIILSFGQSGSGKSLTASGLRNCYKDRGIAPRVISDLFLKKEVLKNQIRLCVQLSYVETKHTYLKDLLSEDSDTFTRSFREITLQKVKSADEALTLLFRAESKREFAANSTTSHGANGIFTITVTAKPANTTDPMKKTSKLHVVDLGGVDSYGNATSINKNISQVGNANVAKTQLEQFILTLIQNRPDCILVKQRLNPLIQYLGDSLSAHSILRCVGHIRVDLPNLYITLSLLAFGQCIRGLKPKRLQPNISKNEEIEIKLLKNQIVGMRKENDLNAMLNCGDLASNITQDRVLQMQNIAKEYLTDITNELVVLNVSDARTVLKVFKDLYNKLEMDKEECVKIAHDDGYQEGFTTAINTEITRSTTKSKESIGVGKLKSSHGNVSLKGSPKKAPSNISKNALGEKRNTLTKRSKTSSLSLKKSSTGKKKSNAGSLHDLPLHLAELGEVKDLPKNVPNYAKAWALFINDNSYNYAKLEEERIASETEAKELQLEYYHAIRQLHKCHETVDLRKNELRKAEMRRLFDPQTCDEDGKAFLSAAETECLDNCNHAQQELIAEQEHVLKKQTEFILALEQTQSIKKDIIDKFDDFCKKHYHISVPDLHATSQLHVVYESGAISALLDEEVGETLPDDEVHNIKLYRQLQRLMKEQILKEIKLTKRRKRWT
ncbi:hypothetical protein PPYR_11902 [Photinus pyralis]|uniref:Kinesin motor domain-containing protein n=2 Tax=Photinus pyralis TaxID=7054 RepID=A0A5N4ACK8_PHOPY|nr:kinesin-like protein KIF9 [Photinus pyralis]KAB0795063.1 hypothetical protein PPYR_11902 [Photinus pyralis]